VFFRCGLGLAECAVGAYKGWVSVLRGVPGFIWSGDGAGRGRERTQSTQTAKKDVAGGKPARFLPKIAELSENFAEQFRVSIITRGDTLLHLIDYYIRRTFDNGRRMPPQVCKRLSTSFPLLAEGFATPSRPPGAPGNLYLVLRSKGGGTDSLASLMESKRGSYPHIDWPGGCRTGARCAE
jgi:hypothetical protein